MTVPRTGTLFSVGVGPGDPELLTLKAARILAAAPAYAFFAKHGRPGHARAIAAAHLPATAEALRFDYPFTTEMPLGDPRYATGMTAFYEASASTVASRLDAGISVAILCEGDPFFYGSAMYLFDRLAPRYPHEVVPGVTGMAGSWARAGLPMVHGDDVMTILPGTLDAATLAARLAQTDAAVIMKIGRHLPKIRAALAQAGRTDAVYVERGTMEGERIATLATLPECTAPYFSLILVPGRQRAR
jgi:precorrin-2/cobalt-factor-2 C20-methyltransferase